jgi:hypothetical protein
MVTFNPFNPFSWMVPSKPLYPSRPAATGPIAVEGRNGDPGLRMSIGKNQITLRGVAAGAKQVTTGGSDPMVMYEVGRGLGFSLDIDKAPTVDAFGKTDYTEKNSRMFSWDTAKGDSAEKIARALARKVNAGDDFKARVSVSPDGSATISFSR